MTHHADCDGLMIVHAPEILPKRHAGTVLYSPNCSCGFVGTGQGGSHETALSMLKQQHGEHEIIMDCDGRCREWDAA